MRIDTICLAILTIFFINVPFKIVQKQDFLVCKNQDIWLQYIGIWLPGPTSEGHKLQNKQAYMD